MIRRHLDIIHSPINYCSCSCSYLIFVLICVAGSDENYASHCSELSRLHQQPVDAVVRPTFIRKLCYKLPSDVTFTFIQQIVSSLLNGVMLTGSVRRNFQNLRYFRCPV